MQRGDDLRGRQEERGKGEQGNVVSVYDEAPFNIGEDVIDSTL